MHELLVHIGEKIWPHI